MQEELLTSEYTEGEESVKEPEKQRPVKKKKRRKKHYLLRLLVLLALIGAAVYFLNSDFFDIDSIAVENNSFYTAEKIIALSGAKRGENIFGSDTQAMKEELLKDPYIRSAQVRRHLPRELRIYVEERSEDAALLYGQEYVIFNLDGMVLRRSKDEPKLPLLVGPTIKIMDVGSPIEVEEKAIFSETLEMIDTMKKADLYFKRIDISNVIVKAFVYDNLVVQGTPENLLASMEDKSLQAVLYDLLQKGTERGTISVGGDAYISFSPALS